MKKLSLLIVVLCLAASIRAQDSTTVYCEVKGSPKTFSSDLKVKIDFGKNSAWWKGEEVAQVENMEFANTIDSLKFLSDKGWTLAQAYAVMNESYEYKYYILKKKVKKVANK
jgi:hypothetical protein